MYISILIAAAVAAQAAPTPAQKVMIEQAVKDKLRDPESARFQHVAPIKLTKSIVFCGRVNAKNAFGGYTGFQPYRVELMKLENGFEFPTIAEVGDLADQLCREDAGLPQLP